MIKSITTECAKFGGLIVWLLIMYVFAVLQFCLNKTESFLHKTESFLHFLANSLDGLWSWSVSNAKYVQYLRRLYNAAKKR